MIASIFELVIILVVAIIIFRLIHRMFNITYFGFKGLFVMFVVCCLVAGLIVDYTFSFIANHYIWSIVIAIGLLILIGVKKSKSQNTSETEA